MWFLSRQRNTFRVSAGAISNNEKKSLLPSVDWKLDDTMQYRKPNIVFWHADTHRQTRFSMQMTHVEVFLSWTVSNSIKSYIMLVFILAGAKRANRHVQFRGLIRCKKRVTLKARPALSPAVSRSTRQGKVAKCYENNHKTATKW